MCVTQRPLIWPAIIKPKADNHIELIPRMWAQMSSIIDTRLYPDQYIDIESG